MSIPDVTRLMQQNGWQLEKRMGGRIPVPAQVQAPRGRSHVGA